jgi:hypothetical protein
MTRLLGEPLLVATLLWLIIIIFSVVGPVPINNRVKAWVAIPTLIAAVEQINSQGLLSRPSLVVTMSIVHAKR